MNLSLTVKHKGTIGQHMNRGKTWNPYFVEDCFMNSIDFNKAAMMMEKMQAERVEKLHEIKRKVRDGTYYVDSEKIAEKILKKILTDEM